MKMLRSPKTSGLPIPFRTIPRSCALSVAVCLALSSCSGSEENNGAVPGVPQFQTPGVPGVILAGSPQTPNGAAGVSQPGAPAQAATVEPVAVAGATVVPQPESGVAAGASACVPGALSLGATPLTRLSSRHLSNGIRDIFGVEESFGAISNSDERGGAFVANIEAPVTDPVVVNYAAIAESVATRVVGKLDDLVDCDRRDAACARAFVEEYAPLVYRRPLEAGEAELLMKVFDASPEFEVGLRLVVRAFLQSPYFLYRDETRGQQVTAGVLRLNSYELATRLALALHNTTPSRELMQLAASGGLDTLAGVSAQVDAMMADPAIDAAISDFHYQWLGLRGLETADKDNDVYPDFNDNVRQAMLQEVERFAQHVIRQGDAKLETLLTAPYTFIDRELFSIYGLEDPGDNHDPDEQVSLDPSQRSGLLTMPALLARFANADSSSPTLRGVWVRENMVCQHLPAPPANVDTVLPDIDPNVTTAERFRLHAESPACSGCHELIDPIGVGFEHYDGIGRWRTEEGNNLQIEASGRVVAVAQGTVEFNGTPELAKALVSTENVQQCVTQQWFNYTMSRPASPADACGMEQALEEFRGSELDIRQLVKKLVTSDAFLHVQAP